MIATIQKTTGFKFSCNFHIAKMSWFLCGMESLKATEKFLIKSITVAKKMVFLSLIPMIAAVSLNLLLWAIPFIVEEETFAPACEVASLYGYECKEYPVTTTDGYILMVHRIWKEKTPGQNQTGSVETLSLPADLEAEANSKIPKPVVFLLHGLDCESTVFMTSTPKYSFAFLLADAGIDVWLGNARGNRYSMTHRSLNSDDPKFWSFSWQEIAEYDVPAMVDLALEETNQEQLSYIAHSQGTLVGLTKMSFDSNFQSKIKKAYLMAPFVTLQNIQSEIRRVLELLHLEYFFMNENDQEAYPFVHHSMIRLSGLVCREPFVPICQFIYHQFSGYTSQAYVDKDRLRFHFSHTMSGTSLKNIRHFAQLHLGKRPRFFDHMDSALNVEKYGSEEPPEVDVTRIGTPVALFAGQNDWLVSSQDIQFLKDRLPNVFMTKNCSDFGHHEFMWGITAVDCAYDPIIHDILQSHE